MCVCVFVYMLHEHEGRGKKINRFNLVLKFNYLINKMLERLVLLLATIEGINVTKSEH